MEKDLVENFSKKMLEKIELRHNRYVPMAWKTMDVKRLVTLVYGELAELGEALRDGDYEHVSKEAIDIANYACFIHELSLTEKSSTTGTNT